MPIFRNSTNKNWIDETSKSISFTKWHSGQRSGGNFAKKFAVVDGEFEYWDDDCEINTLLSDPKFWFMVGLYGKGTRST